MKFFRVLFFVFLFLPVWAPNRAELAPRVLLYKEGELIVKFKSNREVLSQAVHGKLGARVVKNLYKGQLQLVKLPPGMSLEEGIRKYRQDPNVEYAEPNYIVRKAVIPNDPYFTNQWALYNSGTGIDIRAPSAWDLHTGNGTVIVAVIDTGVDYLHPDLRDNIWNNLNEIPNNGVDDDGNDYVDDVRGWNFARGNNDPMDDDADGHGTHVAGIIGAVGNNGIGISGVNWRVKIMPVKVLDETGGGSLADVISGIYYAINNGAKVINASYGYPAYCISVTPSIAEREAIEEANRRGVIFVAAAGNYRCNNDINPFYPASYPVDNVISVGSFGISGGMSGFSNYGSRSVHLLAPGENIYSTIRGSYNYLSGTSMASPFVSGVSALVMSYRPTLSHLQVKARILNGVEQSSSLEGKVMTSGRLNAYRALAVEDLPAIFKLDGREVFPLDRLTLEGINFGSNGRVSVESLDGTVEASVISWSDRSIEIIVPQRAISGYLRVENSIGQSYGFYIKVSIKAPTGLRLRFLSDRSVELIWTDNSTNEEGFIIERKTETGIFSELARVPANTTSYIDASLSPSTTYIYRVRAYNSKDTSGASNEEGIQTAPFGYAQEKDGGGCSLGRGSYANALVWLLLPAFVLARRIRKTVLKIPSSGCPHSE